MAAAPKKRAKRSRVSGKERKKGEGVDKGLRERERGSSAQGIRVKKRDP